MVEIWMLPHFLTYGSLKTGNDLGLHTARTRYQLRQVDGEPLSQGGLEPGTGSGLPLYPQRDQIWAQGQLSPLTSCVPFGK